ncbi:MAG: PEP-CTERM sorting domain-containing protein [Leptothrix sp. (in: b-proteobacteria)]
MNAFRLNITKYLAGAAISCLVTSAFAAPTVYSDRSSFMSAVGTTVTDNYTNPGYAMPSGQYALSDAAMSAVVGQTTYTTTGFSNWNNVNSSLGLYCSGCNASFKLGFASTSVGNSSGVYGMGFDIYISHGFYAYVTYGDNSTSSLAMPYSINNGGFFGLTSANGIKSVNFGLANGGGVSDGTTGYLQIKNLTVAGAPAPAAPVPEPESYAMLLAGLATLGAITRRRKQA